MHDLELAAELLRLNEAGLKGGLGPWIGLQADTDDTLRTNWGGVRRRGDHDDRAGGVGHDRHGGRSDEHPLKAGGGATAEGVIMSVPMLPRDMKGAGKRKAVEMIKEATDMAVQDGASRLGLGAYTSIVTRGGESVTRRGVPVTSGNTLTTVSAVEAIRRVALRCEIDLATAHVAIIGATGAIGRLAALILAREVSGITLIGNAANPFAPRLLDKVAGEVRDVVRCLAGNSAVQSAANGPSVRPIPILSADGSIALICSTDINAAKHADIVFCATSSEITLVDPRSLTPGTLVCDVARPPNVRQADPSETGVLVFDGGLVRPPFQIDLGPFQTLPDNLCWGCLGETVLLSLAREKRDFSIGSRLSLADADQLAILAEAHGFEPAPAQWYGEHVGEQTFADFRDLRRNAPRGAEEISPDYPELSALRPSGASA